MNNRRHHHLSGNCQEQRPNVFIILQDGNPMKEDQNRYKNRYRDNRQFIEASPRSPSPVQAALRMALFPANPRPRAPVYVGPPDRLSLSQGHAAVCGTFWPRVLVESFISLSTDWAQRRGRSWGQRSRGQGLAADLRGKRPCSQERPLLLSERGAGALGPVTAGDAPPSKCGCQAE